MTALALPPPLEAVLQEMERRGRAASAKIEEATKILDESADEVVDFDDPSVVRHADDLQRTTRRLKAITDAPLMTAVPANGEDDTPVVSPRARGFRPPRRPPTREG